MLAGRRIRSSVGKRRSKGRAGRWGSSWRGRQAGLCRESVCSSSGQFGHLDSLGVDLSVDSMRLGGRFGVEVWVSFPELVEGQARSRPIGLPRGSSASEDGGDDCLSDGDRTVSDGCRVHDHGVVLRHGGDWDALGSRGLRLRSKTACFTCSTMAPARPAGLAWRPAPIWCTGPKHGPVLDLGPPGSDDRPPHPQPWVVREGGRWRRFYVGSPNAAPPPGRIPAFPYLTCTASSDRLAGPWRKDPDVKPFRPVPGSFCADTASPARSSSTTVSSCSLRLRRC